MGSWGGESKKGPGPVREKPEYDPGLEQRGSSQTEVGQLLEGEWAAEFWPPELAPPLWPCLCPFHI